MRSLLVSVVVALTAVAAAYADITVETSGVAKVKPDVAYFTFAVSQRGIDLAKVEVDVRQRARGLADKVSKQPGVRSCQVKLVQLSLDQSPSFFDGNVPAPRIYRGSCMMTVECAPEAAIVNKLMGFVSDTGADLTPEASRGYPGAVMPMYGLTKADDANAQAFADALKKARTKAQRLADQAGLKLGRVTSVAEEGAFPRDYSMMVYDAAPPGEYAGPDPQNVQVFVRFRITFETK